MTLTVTLFLALLLLSAIITAVLAALRPRLASLVALLQMALFSFIWVAARNTLPLSSAARSPGIALWSWQVDSVNWPICLAILLLALGALGLTVRAAPERAPQALLIQLLASAALAACWAAGLATYVLTWTLLNGLWLLAAALNSGDRSQFLAHLLRHLALAAGGILILWLAAGSAGLGGGAAGAWPAQARSLLLLAASYQLLVFPLFLWRNQAGATPPVAALLHGAPLSAGAALLARLQEGGDVGLALALPLTLAGLLIVLAGAHRAWSGGARAPALPEALILAQTGFVLLVAIWGGPRAVLAESTVLLLAGGVLLLAVGSEPIVSGRLRLRPGPLVALAALAALPLTAGFTGRSALYDAWIDGARWLLLLVGVLLHITLLTVAFRSVFSSGSTAKASWATGAPDSGALFANRPPAIDVARHAALTLPALGLFSIAAFGQASVGAWLAILLPALIAALLAWRLEDTAELRQTLREAVTLPLPARPGWLDFQRPLAAAGDAARQALALLEGEGGLLWLMVFVVILYLAR